MAEKAKISVSVSKKNKNFAEELQQKSGVSVSSTVDKGLDMARSVERNEQYYSVRIFIAPLLFFLMGDVFFFFSLFFYIKGALSFEMFIVLFIVSCCVVFTAMFILYHAARLWLKTKGAASNG